MIDIFVLTIYCIIRIIHSFICLIFHYFSFPPQEPTHFDADPALIQEDMEVMSDFELHRLCQQYSTISSYQLENNLLLDSGKFHHLTELLASLKNKVNTNVQNRICGRLHAGGVQTTQIKKRSCITTFLSSYRETE